MRILLTGHTGFKGAWLSVILSERGHEVFGISLEPERDSLFNLVKNQINLAEDLRVDIRNRTEYVSSVKKIQPEYIFHLAAQPLVSEGYNSPLETFDVNFTGTLNTLHAATVTDSVRGITVVTTDKVYRNSDTKELFTEDSPLGGVDPYSASKSAADILSQSWASISPKIPITIVRAGNVIGGGDFAKNRLVPDLVRALTTGSKFEIRHPEATRPWQHVADCLSGYMSAAENGLRSGLSKTWNIGPKIEDCKTVEEFVSIFERRWLGSSTKFEIVQTKETYRESSFLSLSTQNARRMLGWENVYNFENSVEQTVKWYKTVESCEKLAFEMCGEDLKRVNISTNFF